MSEGTRAKRLADTARSNKQVAVSRPTLVVGEQARNQVAMPHNSR
jgi:hypothetical protein